MSFETLGLAPAILRALADAGYTSPTPIQAQAIPIVLEGRDLMAGAQTGTGKTAAFSLPLIERLFPAGRRAAPGRKLRALVLTPTRELAAQVQDSLRTYGRHSGMASAAIFGGVGMQPQIDALRRGLDVLVATPGRLLDHVDQRTVDLSQVEILVLDEADRMLDMGFRPQLKRVLAALPKHARQTLMFSATFSDEVKTLAAEFLRDPAEVQVAARNSVVDTVRHVVHAVDAERKRDALLALLAVDSRRRTLVFSRTKHGADKLVRHLERFGIRCAAIHGNKSQGARTKALAGFKSGAVTVLVATDIAARGIDIDQLPAVINFDLPMVAEDYVHRIGRTGRNGATGEAVSLVTHDEATQLRDIQKLLGRELERVPLDGFEPARPLVVAAPGAAGRPRAPARPQSRPAHRTDGRGHAKPSANTGAAADAAARPRRRRRKPRPAGVAAPR
jgi:ATP-dependent RNA helicase RhlE